MEYAINTKELTKRYGKFVAVNHVNMNIPKGSIYGFVGENGSGKTTIIRLLMGLASPTSGSYALFNTNYKDKGIYKVRKNISAIVESPSLVPSMSAYDNLKYACQYFGIKDYSIIEKVLNQVGLHNTGNKKCKNFSLGMRQRLGIAVLLLNNPKLMILDEPMNGLDPEGIAELRDLIISLNKEGITFLISSHILSELEKIATHYGFISHGKLLKEISEDDLIKECAKSIDLKYDDLDKLEKALINQKITDYKVYPNKIRVFKEILPLDLLTKLAKENISIIDIKTNNGDVENYYLSLVKGE